MIGLAMQKGSYVEVYDENGRRKSRFYIGNKVLQGFTSSIINVKDGSYLELYDENGKRRSRTYVR